MSWWKRKSESEADLAKWSTKELKEEYQFQREVLGEARERDNIARGLRNSGVAGTYENFRNPGGLEKDAKAQMKAIQKELKRRAQGGE